MLGYIQLHRKDISAGGYRAKIGSRLAWSFGRLMMGSCPTMRSDNQQCDHPVSSACELGEGSGCEEFAIKKPMDMKDILGDKYRHGDSCYESELNC